MVNPIVNCFLYENQLAPLSHPTKKKPLQTVSLLINAIKISKLRDNKMSPCIFLNTYQAVANVIMINYAGLQRASIRTI